MTQEEFVSIVQAARADGSDHVVVPVPVRRSADLLTPVSAFLSLRQDAPFCFLLESVEGGEKLARYSFIGRNPYRIIQAQDDGATVSINTRRVPGEALRDEPTGDIFNVMADLMDRYDEVDVPGLPRLTGGAVGYMGYDTVRLIEDLPDAPPDDLDVPDAIWAFYDTVTAFDHVRHQVVMIAHAFVDPDTDPDAAYQEAQRRLRRLEADLVQPPMSGAPVRLTGDGMTSNFDQDAFEDAVRTAQQYVYDGDIFQVVLSQRFEMAFDGDRFNLYRALRQVNPSPYLFYLDFDDIALVGSSPEVLVRVEDNRAEVLPIAGTRPRGADEQEDADLADELLADPKERAEHLMLVDLGRNDLGRVCSYDSVEVERYAFIERYSHVMHIVSSVAGTVSDDEGPLDVLAACFPAGTVSGAPKVRAMEIIDELEPSRRGVYAGAVGYIDFNGTLDTCIAIRTMVVRDDSIYVQAGAGIVADSDPTAEYEETRNKAAALREAMRVASDGLL
ncbi:anthranilate synthase component I [Longibacter salinarum]|uniref:Anthranilate synthase component 1 n=1 Tax=Longibacter salinarum TaxID=1850348 RepID=A0A2A8CWY6_9BACT|nr:anthranilate synthase component I [Longibacter salinarum]PEN12898.1 anthranilate synthase component I [Longibacter salinarum]